jgi:hypothetical protein
LRPMHGFCDINRNIIKQNWQLWKWMHGVTSAIMNILLQIFDKEIFTFRKEKKGWYIRTCQKSKYTNFEALFLNFLRMKGAFKKLEGKVFLCRFDCGKFEFGP